MGALLKWVYLLALAIWVGEIVFFSFVVAPTVFRTLGTAEAGRIVGAIFPKYYWVGTACGVLALIGVTGQWLRGGGWVWTVVGGLLIIMLGATLYAGRVVQPRAAALREAMHAGSSVIDEHPSKPEFDRLHRQAVQLNVLVLVCGVIAWGATGLALTATVSAPTAADKTGVQATIRRRTRLVVMGARAG